MKSKNILPFLLIIFVLFISGCGKTKDIITTIDLNSYENEVLITKGGEYKLSGSLEGQLIIDCYENVILTLDGVTINNNNGTTIYVKKSRNLTINCLEETINNLIDGKTYLNTNLKGIFNKNFPKLSKPQFIDKLAPGPQNIEN